MQVCKFYDNTYERRKLVTEYTPPLDALETAGEASSTKYSLVEPESKQY